MVPVSEREDTVGAMARTVKDAARLLQTIVGADENDPYTYATTTSSPNRYEQLLEGVQRVWPTG